MLSDYGFMGKIITSALICLNIFSIALPMLSISWPFQSSAVISILLSPTSIDDSSRSYVVYDQSTPGCVRRSETKGAAASCLWDGE